MPETNDAPYPAHWEAEVLTSDGSVARIRPVVATDRDMLLAMYDRMSDRSKYLRFFSAMKQLPESQLRRITDVDYDRRVTLVARSGDDIVAVGSYYAGVMANEDDEQADPDYATAEVAFAVQDDQQGRGLGSILLEHLAAAAGERGITRFQAEVLTENGQMLGVFLDAGYEVTRQYSSGVIDLVFDISPTAESRAVLVSREQRAEARSIARLLAPRSVAVIGASNDPRKVGHAVLVNLLRGLFTGPVYPVNPDSLSVQGVRAYPSVTDIPDPVDLAVVAIPAAGVHEVMRACQEKGVHGLVVVSAGFADVGDDGASAQRQLLRLARAAGMRVLGPNCLGLVNTDAKTLLNATLAPTIPPAGRIGFFCQSGALGIAILADAAARGLGLSSFVSAGNRADVSGNDLLQFWHTDDRTEVVLLYLESFGNPRKFARIARTVARRKPVIAVKSGRHALVPQGLSLNAIAISEAAVASLFAQSGVIRTNTVSEAFDVALLLSCQPLPASGTVAIIANSTALGLLALDACLDMGLTVSGGAPIDLGAAVTAADMAAAVADAAQSGVGAVLVVFVPPVATDGLAHAAALRDAVADSPVPVLSTFLAVEGVPRPLAVVKDGEQVARGSVPSFPAPERAVAALAAAVRYAQWVRQPAGNTVIPDGMDRAAAADFVAAITPGKSSRALTTAEVVTLLGFYGITVTAEAKPADTAISTVFAIQFDPSFGALVSFGIGGVATELLDDRAYRAVPLTDRDAAELIDSPRAAPLLDGYRGGDVVDRAALQRLALRLSVLADDLPHITELTLGQVMASGEQYTISDVAGIIAPPSAPIDERRRLK